VDQSGNSNQSQQTLYEALGGEHGLRRLVNQFYHRMATLPEAEGIRRMHPEDLSISAEKLFEFLSGWSGGPQLFIEKHGHPRLRARHLPFAIGKSERDQWMLCMVLATEDCGLGEELREVLLEALMRVADHMRNRPETV
jgi:hemoglobin